MVERGDLSALPMIWSDDSVLETVDVKRHVSRYDISNGRPPPSTIYSIGVPFDEDPPSPVILMAMTPDKHYALAQSASANTLPVSDPYQASLYTYATSERRLVRLVRFPKSSLYAALIWNHLAPFLVEMIEVAGNSACYQVRCSNEYRKPRLANHLLGSTLSPWGRCRLDSPFLSEYAPAAFA